MLFAFTSIVANFAYADTNLKYLNLDGKAGHLFLRVGFLAMLLFGSVATLPQVIALADLSTGLMTVVNVTALFLLSKVVINIARDYQTQQAAGKTPEYSVSRSEQEKLGLTPGIWDK